MTYAAHIASVEHELDGFHQSLVEYRQQMGAWYSQALDSVSHAADMPSLLGMERVLRVGDSQRSVSLSDADFSTVARCPVGGVLKIESKFESLYDVPIGDIPVEVIGLDDGSSTLVMLDEHGYLLTASHVVNEGIPINYLYKSKSTTGYALLMGTNRTGQAKFAFAGTNTDGNITTLHTKSGKDFWRMINGDATDKTIRPYNQHL